MSINDSMYIGVSGLQTMGNAISIVGDNIANTSTIGYKSEVAQFSDVLGSAFGAQQIGGGVKLGATETMFGQGSLQQTGNETDMAIQGNGFFVVKGQFNGSVGNYYTRDGQFTLDKTGFAVDSNGMRLQGYAIDASGNRSTSVGDLNLGASTSPASPTTAVTMNMHLSSDAPAVTFDPANPAKTSSYATSETVYDSLGTAHQAQVYMVSNGNGSYDYHAMVDGGETTGGTKGTPVEIASGTLTFNTEGSLQAQTQNVNSASFVNATQNQAISFSFGKDIASGGDGSGSDYSAGTSATDSTTSDGHASGTLTDITIASDGKISGQYSNGQSVDIAQVALATFQNQDGLQREGGNLMAQTSSSGNAAVDAAGANGRGSVTQGALESSNVDISDQLVTLISYQRAFEANSKTITTADQMMQDVNQLKP